MTVAASTGSTDPRVTADTTGQAGSPPSASPANNQTAKQGNLSGGIWSQMSKPKTPAPAPSPSDPSQASAARLLGDPQKAAAPLTGSAPITPPVQTVAAAPQSAPAPAPVPAAPVVDTRKPVDRLSGPFATLYVTTRDERIGVSRELKPLTDKETATPTGLEPGDKEKKDNLAARFDWIGDFQQASLLFACVAQGEAPARMALSKMDARTPLRDIAPSFALLANPRVMGSGTQDGRVAEKAIPADLHGGFEAAYHDWVERMGLAGYYSSTFDVPADGEVVLDSLPKILAYLEITAVHATDRARIAALKGHVQSLGLGDVFQSVLVRLAAGGEPPIADITLYSEEYRRFMKAEQPQGRPEIVPWLLRNGENAALSGMSTDIDPFADTSKPVAALRAYERLFSPADVDGAIMTQSVVDALKALKPEDLKDCPAAKAALSTLQAALARYEAVHTGIERGTMSWSEVKAALSASAVEQLEQTIFQALDTLVGHRDLTVKLGKLERQGTALKPADQRLVQALYAIYHGPAEETSFFDNLEKATETPASQKRTDKVVALVGQLGLFMDDGLVDPALATEGPTNAEDRTIRSPHEQVFRLLANVSYGLSEINTILAGASGTPPKLTNEQIEQVKTFFLKIQSDYREAMAIYANTRSKAPFNDMFADKQVKIEGWPTASFDLVFKRLGVWLSGAEAGPSDPYGTRKGNTWLRGGASELIVKLLQNDLGPLSERMPRLMQLADAVNIQTSGPDMGTSRGTLDLGGSEAAPAAGTAAPSVSPALQSLINADAVMAQAAQRAETAPIAYTPPLPTVAPSIPPPSTPPAPPAGAASASGAPAPDATGSTVPPAASLSYADKSWSASAKDGTMIMADNQVYNIAKNRIDSMSAIATEPTLTDVERNAAAQDALALNLLLGKEKPRTTREALREALNKELPKELTKDVVAKLGDSNIMAPASSLLQRMSAWFDEMEKSGKSPEDMQKELNYKPFARITVLQQFLPKLVVEPALEPPVREQARAHAIKITEMLRRPATTDEIPADLDQAMKAAEVFARPYAPKGYFPEEPTTPPPAGTTPPADGAAAPAAGTAPAAGASAPAPGTAGAPPAGTTPPASGDAAKPYAALMDVVLPGVESIPQEPVVMTDDQKKTLAKNLEAAGVAVPADRELIVRATEVRQWLRLGTGLAAMTAEQKKTTEPTSAQAATRIGAAYAARLQALDAVLGKTPRPTDLSAIGPLLDQAKLDVDTIRTELTRMLEKAKKDKEAASEAQRQELKRQAEEQTRIFQEAQRRAAGGGGGPGGSPPDAKGKKTVKTDEGV